MSIEQYGLGCGAQSAWTIAAAKFSTSE